MPRRPKQFLPLASDRPLIHDTLDRARALAPDERILIVSGEPLRDALTRHLPDLPGSSLMLEPRGRGTAPALAWAAHRILERGGSPGTAVMVSLHSDHMIRPLDRFLATLDRAIASAGRLGRLLTIGIPPARPATGYGYIRMGAEIEEGVLEVERFVEKPDRATAEGYVASGDFLWNSGIFVWRPDVLMAELRAHTPELAEALAHLDAGRVADFYTAAPDLSIDRGLLERTDNIAVVRAEFEWDDVGAWDALRRTRAADAAGNVSIGEAHAVDGGGNVLWAEDGPIVTFGLNDTVVARAFGITFVAPLAHAEDLKEMLSRLPESLERGRQG